MQLKLLKCHTSWSLLPRDAIRRAAALPQDAYHGTKSVGTFWGLKDFMERSDIICLSSPCTGDQGMGNIHALLTMMSLWVEPTECRTPVCPHNRWNCCRVNCNSKFSSDLAIQPVIICLHHCLPARIWHWMNIIDKSTALLFLDTWTHFQTHWHPVHLLHYWVFTQLHIHVELDNFWSAFTQAVGAPEKDVS